MSRRGPHRPLIRTALLAAAGLMGYLLIRARIPITPVVLGLVLGPTLEKEYRTAVILSEGQYDIF